MYSCGLRIGEASPLDIPSINSKENVLRIIGKGNKERIVPLPTSTLHALRVLWKTHRHPRWLFPNHQGDKSIATCVLYCTFDAAVREAGLPTDITPHVLRHSYATRLMENEVDTRIVQILLGHASIQSTSIYTHLTEPTQKKLRNTLDTIMTGI